MKRILLALVALTIPLTLVTSANAATTAKSFVDPAGDVRDVRDTDRVAAGMWADAPLDSIDHTRSSFAHTVVNGRAGTKVVVKVADLMTKAESTNYVQMVIPHLYYRQPNGKLFSNMVSIQVGKAVTTTGPNGTKPCAYATAKFDYMNNTVVAFVPNACFVKPPIAGVVTTYLLNATRTWNMAFDDGRGKLLY